MTSLARLIAVVVAVAASTSPAATQPLENKDCLGCHSDKARQARFEDKSVMSVFIDGERFAQSIHARKPIRCTECHTDLDLDSHPDRDLKDRRSYTETMSALCISCHQDIASRLAHDIHQAQTPKGAFCTDCHDPHYGGNAGAARAQAVEACAKCHSETVKKFSDSAHGTALLAADNADVPVCADCHEPHAMRETRSVEFRLQSTDLCVRCHGDAEKMAKAGLSTAVLQTYLQDFHGVSISYARKERALGGGGALKATCIDCHGAHEMASKGAPGSLAVKANLTKVCARCHEGATDSFSSAWLSHYVPSPSKAPLVYFVRLAYWVFIPFVLSGLVALIGLDLLHLARTRGKKKARSEPTVPIRRFGLGRRVEHWLVVLAFVALLATGLPQKFHDTRWGEWVILSAGGLETLRMSHRIAGILFATLAVGHVAFNLIAVLRGRMRADMLLDRKDFTDTIASLKHTLNHEAPEPKFGRYEYRQKFEYWGMLIGTFVMIATGFTLYYPTVFARFLPGDFIPAAKVAHSYEAMMALLVIIIWHFYCVHLRPGLFPCDMSIFTGKISRERMLEEHPLELERLEATAQAAPPQTAAVAN